MGKIPKWPKIQRLSLSVVNEPLPLLPSEVLRCLRACVSPQALITQARTKQAATMSEVEWRGRTVPVKMDKARVFLLGLADNEAAVAQVSHQH